MRHVTQNLQDPQVLRNKRAAWVLGKSPSAEAHRDRSMVRVRLRVNGDARSGLFVGVGWGTDYPNIHKLCGRLGTAYSCIYVREGHVYVGMYSTRC